MILDGLLNLLPGAAEWSTRRGLLLVFFLGLVALYALTVPFSQGESGDAYFYALNPMVSPLSEITDTRHLLFHALNRLLYDASRSLGFDIAPFGFIVSLSVVTGAAAVLLLARLLIVELGLSRLAGWGGALALAFSYGFWRYTGAAEVYVPTVFALMLVLNLLLASVGANRIGLVIVASAVAGLATLYYQVSAIFLFIGFPVLLLAKARRPLLIVYMIVGPAIVLAGFVSAFLAHHGHWPSITSLVLFVLTQQDRMAITPPSLLNPVKAAVLIWHDWFSTNWIYVFGAVEGLVNRVLPDRFTASLAFAARDFRPFTYVPLVLLPALLALITWMAARILVLRSSRQFDSRILCILAGLVPYALFIGYAAPGVPEPWILTLPFLAILLAVYVFEPLTHANQARVLIGFICMLTAYNYFGGIGMVQARSGDYYFAKTAWLRENAARGDLVVLHAPGGSDTHYLTHYLRYMLNLDVLRTSIDRELYCPARSACQGGSLEHLIPPSELAARRILVFGEFFAPTARRVQGNLKAMHGYARDVAALFRPHATLIASNGVDLYAIAPGSPVAEQFTELARERHAQFTGATSAP